MKNQLNILFAKNFFQRKMCDEPMLVNRIRYVHEIWIARRNRFYPQHNNDTEYVLKVYDSVWCIKICSALETSSYITASSLSPSSLLLTTIINATTRLVDTTSVRARILLLLLWLCKMTMIRAKSRESERDEGEVREENIFEQIRD